MNVMLSPLPTVRRVHDALYQRPLTKADLRRALHLPRMAADRAIFELQTRGLVEAGKLVRVGPKRRLTPKWRLTTEGRELVEKRLELEARIGCQQEPEQCRL